MKIRNCSPHGALLVDGVGLVDADATVDVPADVARRLLAEQPHNFADTRPSAQPKHNEE